MSNYEVFVRRHLHDLFELAKDVLGNDEDAALAAQAMCLREFREREAREWRLAERSG